MAYDIENSSNLADWFSIIRLKVGLEWTVAGLIENAPIPKPNSVLTTREVKVQPPPSTLIRGVRA